MGIWSRACLRNPPPEMDYGLPDLIRAQQHGLGITIEWSLEIRLQSLPEAPARPGRLQKEIVRSLIENPLQAWSPIRRKGYL